MHHRRLMLCACAALLAACGDGKLISSDVEAPPTRSRQPAVAWTVEGTNAQAVYRQHGRRVRLVLDAGAPDAADAGAVDPGSSSSSSGSAGSTGTSASSSSTGTSSSSSSGSSGSTGTGSSSSSTGSSASSSSGSSGSTSSSSSSGSSGSTGTSSSSSSSGSTGTTGGIASSGVPTLGGCALFPPDSIWNTDITNAPISAHSAEWVAGIGASTGMHPDFGTVWNGAPNGIPFLVVPQGTAPVPVSFYYASESDPGPYPAPLDAPIEGGPQSTGDRHVLVVEQGTCTLYEMFDSHPGTSSWSAGSGAIWHLDQNEQRPAGWTSADASGLAVLPGLVKYDEVASGEIRHAIRVTAWNIQHAYIRPASHSDGTADATHAPMGARFRLHASFDETPFPPEVQVIIRAMKRYGVILADTGGDWSITGSPDMRWSDANLHTLINIHGSDFDAIDNGPVVAY